MSGTLSKLRSGFSVVELLLALAISSLLLVAVGVVFEASIASCRENEDAFNTINRARQALFRITSQLRTAAAVDPNSPDNECALITIEADEADNITYRDITYRYEDGDDKLYLVTNDDLSDPNYVLCENVTAMTFEKDTAVDDEGETYVKSVQIFMTVASGDVNRSISAAAVIRRNLKWD